MLRRKVLSLATALVSLLPGFAIAQDNTTPPPAPPPAAEPAPAATSGDQKNGEKTEEIVVTGSRIRRKDLNTPAPVTVLSKETYTVTGKASLGDFLQTLPEQGNAVNTQVNNGNDGSVQVNLRSLDPQRTLVLVNGRRFVAGGEPQSPATAVDLNTIPVAAIERIEILKDGASAVYGSDAIAGVVNIILKKRFNGTEVSAFSGTTSRGDGTTYDLSAITGTGSDKGNILFSVGYQEQQSVLAGDRKWSQTAYDYNFDTHELTPSGNSTTFPAGRFAIPNRAATCATTTNPNMQALCAQFAAAGADATNSFVPQGGNSWTMYDSSLFNTNPTNYLVTPNRRIQLFATGDTNIGSVARGFFEASYVNRTSAQTLAPMPLVNNTIPTKPVTVSKDSMFNNLGADITSWRVRTVEFGDRRFSQDLDTFHVVTGVDGQLGDYAGFLRGWSWDISYNYGKTAGTEVNAGQLRMPNVALAVGPSMPDPLTGAPTCVRVAGLIDTRIPGCVPMDVLHGISARAGNAAAKDFVAFDGTLRSQIRQDVYSANASGELGFTLLSDRPVGLALGIDHRREAGRFLPDVITASLESSGNNVLPTDGSYNVTEGYAELSVPIISNRPFIEQLEASAAVRFFDYSTFGSDSTYKFGARYTPVSDITFRGTLSTAFRAPNVPELFGGAFDSYDFATDPCDGPTDPNVRQNCIAHGVPSGNSQDPSQQFLTKKIANPDLKPETADVFTAGVVLAPRWVRNLSLTVDYFNIDLSKRISTRTAATILNQCYSGGNAALCDLVIRDPAGQVVQINDLRSNNAKLKTDGFDIAARYALPTAGFGRFSFIVDAAILNSYTKTNEFGQVIRNAGNYDDLLQLPKYKFNAGVAWGLGNLGVGATTRYFGGFVECASGLCAEEPNPQRRIDAWYAFDAYASYALRSTAGRTSVAVGVQNLADKDPPYSFTAAAVNSDPGYDFLGRFFYARLTQAF
jgi:iron complex outermembrane recepter protein